MAASALAITLRFILFDILDELRLRGIEVCIGWGGDKSLPRPSKPNE
jgi:hypothetical protein